MITGSSPHPRRHRVGRLAVTINGQNGWPSDRPARPAYRAPAAGLLARRAIGVPHHPLPQSAVL